MAVPRTSPPAPADRSDVVPRDAAAGSPAAPSRRERKKAATREKLIDCASRLFLDKGYEQTTVEEITEAADVAPATFYSYFSSKGDVAMARLDEWLDAMFDALSARPLEEDPDVMLAAAFAQMTELGYVGTGRVRGQKGEPLPAVPMAALWAESSPEVAGRFYQSLIRGQQRLTPMFRERMGCPEEALEPRIVAATYFATVVVSIYGFADVLQRDPDPGPPQDLALQAIEAYMEGIRAVMARARRRPTAKRSAGSAARRNRRATR